MRDFNLPVELVKPLFTFFNKSLVSCQQKNLSFPSGGVSMMMVGGFSIM